MLVDCILQTFVSKSITWYPVKPVCLGEFDEGPPTVTCNAVTGEEHAISGRVVNEITMKGQTSE